MALILLNAYKYWNFEQWWRSEDLQEFTYSWSFQKGFVTYLENEGCAMIETNNFKPTAKWKKVIY